MRGKKSYYWMESGKFLGCENRHRNEERGREERNQVFFLCLKGAAELRIMLREFFMCSECKAVG